MIRFFILYRTADYIVMQNKRNNKINELYRYGTFAPSLFNVNQQKVLRLIVPNVKYLDRNCYLSRYDMDQTDIFCILWALADLESDLMLIDIFIT